jgi:1,2-beta-oligoglucan phosphorylase
MHTHTTVPISYPVHINSPSGLCVQVNTNGSIRRMDYHDIIVNAFLGTEVEGGPSNIYLSRHGTASASIPLLGPRSPAAFHHWAGEGRVPLPDHGARAVAYGGAAHGS